MRAALISIAGQPHDAVRGTPLQVGGKSIAHRQLDFAIAAGCETVIALGDGGSPEAIGLRHAAEAAGARFQSVRDSHALLGAVRADDELLAIAPGLLPDSADPLEALGKGKVILVLPAGAGVAAGFERIDLDRAWAGMVMVGGAQVERLSDLPPDTEAASALVRTALQARLPEKRLPEHLLVNGAWSVVNGEADAAALEQAWLKRHLAPETPWTVSTHLADMGLRALASRLLGARRSAEVLAGGVVALLAGSLVLGSLGFASWAFATVFFAAVLAHGTCRLGSLRRAPFARPRPRLWFIFPALTDAALIACSVFAIGGPWLNRLFAPLVLLGSLHALRRVPGPALLAVLSERASLAAFLAIAAMVGLAEPAMMAASLAFIALNAAYSGASRG